MKKIDPRTVDIPTDKLKRIAEEPTGGSGVSVFINGTIQSMAREILKFRGEQ